MAGDNRCRGSLNTHSVKRMNLLINRCNCSPPSTVDVSIDDPSRQDLTSPGNTSLDLPIKSTLGNMGCTDVSCLLQSAKDEHMTRVASRSNSVVQNQDAPAPPCTDRPSKMRPAPAPPGLARAAVPATSAAAATSPASEAAAAPCPVSPCMEPGSAPPGSAHASTALPTDHGNRCGYPTRSLPRHILAQETTPHPVRTPSRHTPPSNGVTPGVRHTGLPCRGGRSLDTRYHTGGDCYIPPRLHFQTCRHFLLLRETS